MTVSPDTRSDSELLARARGGQATALAALLERHEQAVYCYLIGVLRDRHAADDVLQDTFVQAVRKCDGVVGESFRSWLFAVAHQQAMLHRRRAKRLPAGTTDEPLLELVGAALDPALAAEAAETAQQVRRLLALLPPAQQDVIRLRMFDGLKFREVAARLGCPLNTALARMHDGLKTLRHLWEERHV